jgi:uncharacterized protein
MLEQVIESCVAHVGVDPAQADADLMRYVPGFDGPSAKAFVAWREQHGPIRSKAQLAAVEGVGPARAEQAVGFLRIPDAEDPRDRAQLHPEQYDALEKMAAQAGVDLETLFSDADARRRVHLDALVDESTPLGLLKYALFQATAGTRDPRPRWTRPIPPPETITLQTLRPDLVLQGRVLRAAPFGVFVDVGLGVEALLPVPHMGDRPGLEPSTVAPVGAVITARVLDVDLDKQRITLTMRRAQAPHGRGPAGRGPGGRGPSGPGARGPGPRGGEAGRPGAPRRDERRPAQPVGAGAGGGGRPQGRGGEGRGGGGRPQGGSGGGGRGRGPRQGGGGRFGGGGFTFDDRRGGRGGRGERGPRTISLKPDDPRRPEGPRVDESSLSPEELMQRKIEELKRRLERPDA